MPSLLALKALSIPVSYLPRSGPIVRRLAPKGGPVARQRFRCGATFDLDLSDRIQAEAFVQRSYQRPLCEWIASRLGPGTTFIDVGANVGMVSFSAAMTGARVIAFEPLASNCERWRTNRAFNPDADAELVEAAVGDHEGIVRLWAYAGAESGWNHISERGDIEVRQITLDDYTAQHDIDRVDVLKVDVEGYEPAVLAGAEQLLSEGRVRALVCELKPRSADQLREQLAGLGYREERISRMDSAFVR